MRENHLQAQQQRQARDGSWPFAAILILRVPIRRALNPASCVSGCCLGTVLLLIKKLSHARMQERWEGLILGLYWDNGKENGNYYIIIGVLYWGYIRIMERKWKLLYYRGIIFGLILGLC